MIPRSAETLLKQSAQSVIDRVCTARLGQMRQAPRREVDFIASFIENGVGLLATAWRHALPSANVQVGGVFCHGSPKVTVKGSPPPGVTKYRCELADLLIVHTHIAQRTYRRAVLIQTKADPGGSFKPDEPQLWLYRDWPLFAINGPAFDPRDRDFANDPRSGLYGLVSKTHWLIAPPAARMASSNPGVMPFSTFLVNMLYDLDPAQDGRHSLHGRQLYENSKADWSKTIWDLLEVTAALPLVHRGPVMGNYAAPLPSRMGGTFALATQASIAPPMPPERWEAMEDDNVFGILAIQTESSD